MLTFSRWNDRPGLLHSSLIVLAACALSAGLALPLQAAGSAPDLWMAAGDFETPQALKSTAAVEGLNIEVRADLLSAGTKRFRFQGFGGASYAVELERIERPVPGATHWLGRVADFGEHSQVMLSSYGEAVAGLVDTPEGRYEISPRPGGHVMIKVDSTRFAGCATRPGEQHGHELSAADIDRAARDLGVAPQAVREAAGRAGEKATPLLEIAVVFSQEAWNRLGGSDGALAHALSSLLVLDTALDSSGINAVSSLAGWEAISSDSLGDSSGGGDGLVLAMYSDGSGLKKDGDQEFHQNDYRLADSAAAGDGFGEVLAYGDFNGDGYDDLAVGIPGEDIAGASSTGAVQILYGTDSGLTTAGADFLHQDTPGVEGGNQSGDQFGFALAVGDFDGDGYDDLAVGKPFEDLSGADNTGRVNVLYGSRYGISTSGDQSFDQDSISAAGPNEDGDNFGRALAAGDFDGDGYDDLAVGISEEDWSGKNNAGRVAVIYGSGAGLDGSDSQAFDQDTPGVANSPEGDDRFGRSLAAGDFDRDGYDDLVIGAPYEDSNGKNAGVIHALYGSPSGLSGSGSQTFSQDDLGDKREKNDYFGHALAVGDFNDDGHDDVLASAPYEDSNNRGRVHVLHGRASGLVNAGYSLSGAAGAEMGFALAAGDFNGDGRDDFALGQPGADEDGASDSGKVVIFHAKGSGSFPVSYAGAWGQDSNGVKGEAEKNDELGYALAAGDFDGDGVADLAIGVAGEGVSNESDYFKAWLGTGGASPLRNRHSADLVGLIVENMDDACGSAQAVMDDPSGDASTFYQVTARSCSVSNLSYAHEIGHLLGLAHNPENTSASSGACSDARGHYVSGQGRTLMSYSNPCTNGHCDRVALISNPDVDFAFGSPSGISGSRDNARCAGLTVGHVAAYN